MKKKASIPQQQAGVSVSALEPLTESQSIQIEMQKDYPVAMVLGLPGV